MTKHHVPPLNIGEGFLSRGIIGYLLKKCGEKKPAGLPADLSATH
jgi:hypothetical protein